MLLLMRYNYDQYSIEYNSDHFLGNYYSPIGSKAHRPPQYVGELNDHVTAS